MELDLGAVLSVTARLALVTTFLWAAVSKVRATGALRETLIQLGTPSALARLTAPAVVLAETGAAVGLLVAPRSTWPLALVLLLATGFAGAGVLAIATGRRVACACFGNVGRTRLGWRQVVLLPGWVGLVLASTVGPPGWTVDEGLAVLALVLCGLAATQVPAVLGTVRRLRADRVAIASVYDNADSDDESDSGEAVR